MTRIRGGSCPHGNINKGKCKLCRREYHKQYAREHYSQDKTKAAYQANRLKILVNTSNLRAKRLGIAGVLVVEDMTRLNQECRYCKANQFSLHIEHIIPLAAGGSNEPSNVGLACEFCNRAKNSRSEQDFLNWLDYIRTTR